MVASLDQLSHLAGLLTRNDTDAADLVQATCLHALERVSKLVSQVNIPGWLKRLMRNLHVDELRSPARRSCRRGPDPDDLPHPTEPLPLWRVVDDGDMDKAASRLSPTVRETWDLYHRDQLDQQEIAERLRIPRATVATRIFRAKATVRDGIIEMYQARAGLPAHKTRPSSP